MVVQSEEALRWPGLDLGLGLVLVKGRLGVVYWNRAEMVLSFPVQFVMLDWRTVGTSCAMKMWHPALAVMMALAVFAMVTLSLWRVGLKGDA